MIYVISDIHGCYDEFMEMLDKIKFSDNDAMYILGDMIDRGEDSIKVVQHVMSSKNMKAFLGNHENFMSDKEIDLWKFNGGKKTLEGFSKLTDIDKKEFIKCIHGLPTYKKITVNGKKIWLVHAGLKIDEDGEVTREQDAYFNIWAREEYYRDKRNPNDIIISGHTQTFLINPYMKKWESKILKRGNRFLIDCGCAYGGRLACLRLNDFKEYYVRKKIQ